MLVLRTRTVWPGARPPPVLYALHDERILDVLSSPVLHHSDIAVGFYRTVPTAE